MYFISTFYKLIFATLLSTLPLSTYPLLLCHLSFNNPPHILSPARSLRRIANKEQLNTRENLNRTEYWIWLTSYLPVTKKPCPSSVKKVHRADSQPFHYQKMVMLCIKGPSEMPFVSDMAGLHHFYHLTVFVDTISLLNML